MILKEMTGGELLRSGLVDFGIKPEVKKEKHPFDIKEYYARPDIIKKRAEYRKRYEAKNKKKMNEYRKLWIRKKRANQIKEVSNE